MALGESVMAGSVLACSSLMSRANVKSDAVGKGRFARCPKLSADETQRTAAGPQGSHIRSSFAAV
jgi:hypothetical protein